MKILLNLPDGKELTLYPNENETLSELLRLIVRIAHENNVAPKEHGWKYDIILKGDSLKEKQKEHNDGASDSDDKDLHISGVFGEEETIYYKVFDDKGNEVILEGVSWVEKK